MDDSAALVANLAFKTIAMQAWMASRRLMDGKPEDAQRLLREIVETCDEGQKALKVEP